jgi:hypothetical protein
VEGVGCRVQGVCDFSSFFEANKARCRSHAHARIHSTQCLGFKVSEVIITCACSSEASPVPLCPSEKNRMEPLLEGRRL